MIKIISFSEWFEKWEGDLSDAYDGSAFDAWAREQYRMWKEDAEDRNHDC